MLEALIDAWGRCIRLIQLLAESLAIELVLSCRRLDAASAISCGLISLLHGDFETELASAVARSAARPLGVSCATKKQLQGIRRGRFYAREDAAALLTALGDPESQRAALDHMARKSSKKA